LPSVRVNGTVCLAFYYHMWGYHMGALEVYVKRADQYMMQWPMVSGQWSVNVVNVISGQCLMTST